MKNLVRAAVVGATLIFAVVATVVPAQAYYREVRDPTGDVQVESCARTQLVPLDLHKVKVSSYAAGGRWRMDLTIALVDLPRPGRGEVQDIQASILAEGHTVLEANFIRIWKHGRLKRQTYVAATWDPDDYSRIRAHVKVRGNSLTFARIPLRAGHSFEVVAHAYAGRGHRCRTSDDSARLGPLLSSG